MMEDIGAPTFPTERLNPGYRLTPIDDEVVTMQPIFETSQTTERMRHHRDVGRVHESGIQTPVGVPMKTILLVLAVLAALVILRR